MNLGLLFNSSLAALLIPAILLLKMYRSFTLVDIFVYKNGNRNIFKCPLYT